MPTGAAVHFFKVQLLWSDKYLCQPTKSKTVHFELMQKNY